MSTNRFSGGDPARKDTDEGLVPVNESKVPLSLHEGDVVQIQGNKLDFVKQDEEFIYLRSHATGEVLRYALHVLTMLKACLETKHEATPQQRRSGFFDIVGNAADTLGLEQLQEIGGGELAQEPRLEKGEQLVCYFDRSGMGAKSLVKVIICHSSAERQELNQAYRDGWALKLSWYKAPETFLGLSTGEFKPLT